MRAVQKKTGDQRSEEKSAFSDRPNTRSFGSALTPDAKLAIKSSNAGAIPAYMGHVLTENRNGLVVDTRLTEANGPAEREAAIEMLAELAGEARKTVGADRAYDSPLCQ